MVHANVGAVLAVDYGSEAITNDMLLCVDPEHPVPVSERERLATRSKSGNGVQVVIVDRSKQR